MATSIIKNLIQFTPLTSSTWGCIKIPIAKLCVVWSVYPMASMTYNSSSGGYEHTLDLSSYGFTGEMQGLVTARYGGGFPRVGIATIGASSARIMSDVNASTGYVHWIVIGAYS